MLAMALEKLMRVSLENHLYTFNGEIRLQSSGGAIRDRETGAIATVFMLIWMRKLQEKLDNNNLTCYMKQVYVDDGNNILEAVPRGARVVEDLVVVDEEEAETDSRPADLRTAEVVRDLANNIYPFIKAQFSIFVRICYSEGILQIHSSLLFFGLFGLQGQESTTHFTSHEVIYYYWSCSKYTDI